MIGETIMRAAVTSWLNTPTQIEEMVSYYNADIPNYYQFGQTFALLWRQYFDITLNN
jgi:hypothetical protein